MSLNKAYYGGYTEKAKKRKCSIVLLCAAVLLAIIIVFVQLGHAHRHPSDDPGSVENISLDTIPEYSGSPYIEINNNVPYFLDDDLTTETYENYSQLDYLGRCGSAMACLGIETMPTEERGSIGMIKPTGWHTIRYDGIIEDKYLYNRCHSIAYSLSGENANELNLITGTRYLNVSGMLPYEIKTADYIEETHNHVLYRVTPIFDGDNLLASGVLMEAKSVEDNGAGLQFNIYAYNIQPGILIDYCDGESSAQMHTP